MSGLRVRRGRLLYRRRGDGRVRGREDFVLTHDRDGGLTLRTVARTDDSRFVRDAVVTVDAERRPRDVFLRLQVASSWIGSGWLRCVGERLRVRAALSDGEEADEVLNVPDRVHVMTHAVMHDGWTFWAWDPAGAARQTLTVYNTSTRWDGTDGPLGRLETVSAEAIGEEEVEVPAGVFSARRFRLASATLGSPPADLWVTGDDNLLVRFDWPDFDLEYVLDSLIDTVEG